MKSFIAERFDAQYICYATMASVAAIMYDQTLNFSQEIDFVWNHRWTIVTALYFVARYCGPVSQFAMLSATLPLNWTAAGYKYIIIAGEALSFMFIVAMQVILLLRAHALCSRSRRILVVLSVSFVCEMIVIVVVVVKSLDLVAKGGLATFMDPTDRVQRAANANSYTLGRWLTVYRAIQLAFDILLLVVALFGSVKHASEVGGWSVSPLVKALAKDQIAYFVWYAVWQGTSLLTIIGVNVGISALDALNALFGAFAIIAGPRMVISLRVQELKTREGTLQTLLSTMQFYPREPMHTSSRHAVDSDA
ncbi:hypothetical protein BV22DRAFT_1039672 [Leucogyrophana mollusca]|uniref:Uncharacterized protein n=1 Tax=Leucogyrophana mollusca TaxID=85980 RepID=A0ACB8B744_9AGAM|nr:hypothetical protein BV22DRAFT_1039672 [Leucogyrophana mollusca]